MLSTSNWRHANDDNSRPSGILKQEPEDFKVTEELGYAPCGEGEHQYLWVEKTLANTAWVAEQLAKYTGLPLRQVTYAGRKDKYAVTQQWFGIHAPGKADFDFSSFNCDGVKILSQHRHNKKLRTGQLRGNRFAITLKQVSDPESLIKNLNRAAVDGVPNYFGEQRFGTVRVDENGQRQEGGNLQLAEKMLNGEVIRNRNKRNMAISALRSWLFNEVISQRITNGQLNVLLAGDALMLNGSNSFFINDLSDDLPARYAQQDLAPTAALWGKGKPPCLDDALALEMSVANTVPKVCNYLQDAGLKQERRPVKIWPQQLEWQHNGDTVKVEFSLPSGCYATTVLRECIDF